MATYNEDMTPVFVTDTTWSGYTTDGVATVGYPDQKRLDTRSGGVQFSFSAATQNMVIPGIDGILPTQYCIIKDNYDNKYIVALNPFKWSIGTKSSITDVDVITLSVFKIVNGLVQSDPLTNLEATIYGPKHNSFSFVREIVGNFATIAKSDIESFVTLCDSAQFFVQLRNTETLAATVRGELLVPFSSIPLATIPSEQVEFYKVPNRNKIRAQLNGTYPELLGIQWSLYSKESQIVTEYYVSPPNLSYVHELYNAAYNNETNTQVEYNQANPLPLTKANYNIDAVLFYDMGCVSVAAVNIPWDYSVNPIRSPTLTQIGSGDLRLDGTLKVNPMTDPSADDEIYPTGMVVSVETNGKCFYKKVVTYPYDNTSVFSDQKVVTVSINLGRNEWYEFGSTTSKNGVANFTSGVVSTLAFNPSSVSIYVINGNDVAHTSESVTINVPNFSEPGMYNGVVTVENGSIVDEQGETYPTKVRITLEESADEQFAEYKFFVDNVETVAVKPTPYTAVIDLGDRNEHQVSVQFGFRPFVYYPNQPRTIGDHTLYGATKYLRNVQSYVNKYVPIDPVIPEVGFLSTQKTGDAIPYATLLVNNEPNFGTAMQTTVSYQLNITDEEGVTVATSVESVASIGTESTLTSSNLQELTGASLENPMVGQSFTIQSQCVVTKIRASVTGEGSYLIVRQYVGDDPETAFGGEVIATSLPASVVATSSSELSTYDFTPFPLAAAKYTFQVLKGTAWAAITEAYGGGSAISTTSYVSDLRFEVHSSAASSSDGSSTTTSIVIASNNNQLQVNVDWNDRPGQSFTSTYGGVLDIINVVTHGNPGGYLKVLEYVNDDINTRYTGRVLATSNPSIVSYNWYEKSTYIFPSENTTTLLPNTKYVFQVIYDGVYANLYYNEYSGGRGYSNNHTDQLELVFDVRIKSSVPDDTIVTASNSQPVGAPAPVYGQSFTPQAYGSLSSIEASVRDVNLSSSLVVREWVSDYDADKGPLVSTSILTFQGPNSTLLYMFPSNAILGNKKYVFLVQNGTPLFAVNGSYTGGNAIEPTNHPGMDMKFVVNVSQEFFNSIELTSAINNSVVTNNDIGYKSGQTFRTTVGGKLNRIRANVDGEYARLALKKYVSDEVSSAFNGDLIRMSDITQKASRPNIDMSTFTFTDGPILEANTMYFFEVVNGTPYFNLGNPYADGKGQNAYWASNNYDPDIGFEVIVNTSSEQVSATNSQDASHTIVLRYGQSFKPTTSGVLSSIELSVTEHVIGMSQLILREYTDRESAFTNPPLCVSQTTFPTQTALLYSFQNAPLLDSSKQYFFEVINGVPLLAANGNYADGQALGVALGVGSSGVDANFRVNVIAASSNIIVSNLVPLATDKLRGFPQSVGLKFNASGKFLTAIKASIEGYGSLVISKYVSDEYETAFSGAYVGTSDVMVRNMYGLSLFEFNPPLNLVPGQNYVAKVQKGTVLAEPAENGNTYCILSPNALSYNMNYEVYTSSTITSLVLQNPYTFLDDVTYNFQLVATIVEASMPPKTHTTASAMVSSTFYSRPQINEWDGLIVDASISNVTLDFNQVGYTYHGPNPKLTVRIRSAPKVTRNLPVVGNTPYGTSFFAGTYDLSLQLTSPMYVNNALYLENNLPKVKLLPNAPTYSSVKFMSDQVNGPAIPVVTDGDWYQNETDYYICELFNGELFSTFNFRDNTYNVALQDGVTYDLHLRRVMILDEVEYKSNPTHLGLHTYYDRPTLDSWEGLFQDKTVGSVTVDFTKVVTNYSGNDNLTVYFSMENGEISDVFPFGVASYASFDESHVRSHTHTLRIASDMYPLGSSYTDDETLIPNMVNIQLSARFEANGVGDAVPTIDSLIASVGQNYYTCEVYDEQYNYVGTYSFLDQAYTDPTVKLVDTVSYYAKVYNVVNLISSRQDNFLPLGVFLTRPTLDSWEGLFQDKAVGSVTVDFTKVVTNYSGNDNLMVYFSMENGEISDVFPFGVASYASFDESHVRSHTHTLRIASDMYPLGSSYTDDETLIPNKVVFNSSLISIFKSEETNDVEEDAPPYLSQSLPQSTESNFYLCDIYDENNYVITYNFFNQTYIHKYDTHRQLLDKGVYFGKVYNFIRGISSEQDTFLSLGVFRKRPTILSYDGLFVDNSIGNVTVDLSKVTPSYIDDSSLMVYFSMDGKPEISDVFPFGVASYGSFNESDVRNDHTRTLKIVSDMYTKGSSYTINDVALIPNMVDVSNSTAKFEARGDSGDADLNISGLPQSIVGNYYTCDLYKGSNYVITYDFLLNAYKHKPNTNGELEDGVSYTGKVYHYINGTPSRQDAFIPLGVFRKRPTLVSWDGLFHNKAIGSVKVDLSKVNYDYTGGDNLRIYFEIENTMGIYGQAPFGVLPYTTFFNSSDVRSHGFSLKILSNMYPLNIKYESEETLIPNMINVSPFQDSKFRATETTGDAPPLIIGDYGQTLPPLVDGYYTCDIHKEGNYVITYDFLSKSYKHKPNTNGELEDGVSYTGKVYHYINEIPSEQDTFLPLRIFRKRPTLVSWDGLFVDRAIHNVTIDFKQVRYAYTGTDNIRVYFSIQGMNEIYQSVPTNIPPIKYTNQFSSVEVGSYTRYLRIWTEMYPQNNSHESTVILIPDMVRVYNLLAKFQAGETGDAAPVISLPPSTDSNYYTCDIHKEGNYVISYDLYNEVYYHKPNTSGELEDGVSYSGKVYNTIVPYTSEQDAFLPLGVFRKRPTLTNVPGLLEAFPSVTNVMFDLTNAVYNYSGTDLTLSFSIEGETIITDSYPFSKHKYPSVLDVGNYTCMVQITSEMYPLTNSYDSSKFYAPITIRPNPVRSEDSVFSDEFFDPTINVLISGGDSVYHDAVPVPGLFGLRNYMIEVYDENYNKVSTYYSQLNTYTNRLVNNTKYYGKIYTTKNGITSIQDSFFKLEYFYSRPVINSANIFTRTEQSNTMWELNLVNYTYSGDRVQSVVKFQGQIISDPFYKIYEKLDVGPYPFEVGIRTALYRTESVFNGTVTILPDVMDSVETGTFLAGSVGDALPYVSIPESQTNDYYTCDIFKGGVKVTQYNFFTKQYTPSVQLENGVSYTAIAYHTINGYTSPIGTSFPLGKFYTRPMVPSAADFYNRTVNDIGVNLTQSTMIYSDKYWLNLVLRNIDVTIQSSHSESLLLTLPESDVGENTYTLTAVSVMYPENSVNTLTDTVALTPIVVTYTGLSFGITNLVVVEPPLPMSTPTDYYECMVYNGSKVSTFSFLNGTYSDSLTSSVAYQGTIVHTIVKNGQAYVSLEGATLPMGTFYSPAEVKCSDLSFMYSSMETQTVNGVDFGPTVDLRKCVFTYGADGVITVQAKNSVDATWGPITTVYRTMLVRLDGAFTENIDVRISVTTAKYGKVSQTFSAPLYKVSASIKIESFDQELNPDVMSLFNANFTQYKYRLYVSDIPSIQSLEYSVTDYRFGETNVVDGTFISGINGLSNQSFDTSFFMDMGYKERTLQVFAMYPNTVEKQLLYTASVQASFAPFIFKHSDVNGYIYSIEPLTSLTIIDDLGNVYTQSNSTWFAREGPTKYRYELNETWSGWLLSVGNASGTTEFMNGQIYNSLSTFSNYSGTTQAYITGVEYDSVLKKLALTTSQSRAGVAYVRVKDGAQINYANSLLEEVNVSTQMTMKVENHRIVETWLPGWVGVVTSLVNGDAKTYEEVVSMALPDLDLNLIELDNTRFVLGGFSGNGVKTVLGGEKFYKFVRGTGAILSVSDTFLSDVSALQTAVGLSQTAVENYSAYAAASDTARVAAVSLLSSVNETLDEMVGAAVQTQDVESYRNALEASNAALAEAEAALADTDRRISILQAQYNARMATNGTVALALSANTSKDEEILDLQSTLDDKKDEITELENSCATPGLDQLISTAKTSVKYAIESMITVINDVQTLTTSLKNVIIAALREIQDKITLIIDEIKKRYQQIQDGITQAKKDADDAKAYYQQKATEAQTAANNAVDDATRQASKDAAQRAKDAAAAFETANGRLNTVLNIARTQIDSTKTSVDNAIGNASSKINNAISQAVDTSFTASIQSTQVAISSAATSMNGVVDATNNTILSLREALQVLATEASNAVSQASGFFTNAQKSIDDAIAAAAAEAARLKKIADDEAAAAAAAAAAATAAAEKAAADAAAAAQAEADRQAREAQAAWEREQERIRNLFNGGGGGGGGGCSIS